MSDFLNKGDKLTINGYGPLTIDKWEASWSLGLEGEHDLYILFEEAGPSKKYVKFVSANRIFVGLEKVLKRYEVETV